MKYLKKYERFFLAPKNDEIRKGDILVSRILEYCKKNLRERLGYPQIEIADKLYYFYFAGADFAISEMDDYFLRIYRRSDMMNIHDPPYKINDSALDDQYRISKKMAKNFYKARCLEFDKIEPKYYNMKIPDKFLSDEKFMNFYNELSDDVIDAKKYNL